MYDLFGREQQIHDLAVKHMNEVHNGSPYDFDAFKTLVKEYGKLLKQLRRVTKISDRTTVDLNTRKLDLLDKVHFDALTGIYNRRFMEESLSRIVKTISRSGGVLSILMIDIDFFKRYNDTYGHHLGDECLKTVARTLTDCLTREDDFVARYGGEEFIVILPNTDETGACTVASRMLEGIRACNIPHQKNEAADYVTISIGGTVCDVDSRHNSTYYMEQADKALYRSKQTGRNKFTFVDFRTEDETRKNQCAGRKGAMVHEGETT